MPWTSELIKWLVDTGERLKTNDGKEIKVWESRQEKKNEKTGVITLDVLAPRRYILIASGFE